MKNILKAKSENKGFTLVELIIVVAVIAILATVLAPQYIRYVERSRESNDLQVATTIVRAATVAVADPQLDLPANATYTVTWNTTGTNALTVTGATGGTSAEQTAENNSVRDSIAAVLGWLTTAGAYADAQVTDAQSSAGNTQNFTFTIAVETGRVVVTAPAGATVNEWVTNIGVDSAA